MNIVGGVIIFLLWWWVVFFTMLPRNIESRWEGEDDGVEGADPGAPVAPRLREKAVRTTVIAAVLTAVTIAIILSGVIDFRE